MANDAAHDMHANQVHVSAETVRQLIAEQFPRWRALEITPLRGTGTVNAIFRVGDALAARFPLVVDRVESIQRRLEREADAAREIIGRTRFVTPEPVALGRPGAGYPGPWSLYTWVSGTAATEDDPGKSVDFARDLAEFVRDVREIPTGDRGFSGKGRGGDLRNHDEWVEFCFAQSDALLDVPRLRSIWQELRDLPREDGDLMNHGDLIPGNLLVDSGRLVGVLDVGGLGPADPALDLVGAWHLLEDQPRKAFREDLSCGDLQWLRGKAWAFEQAMGAVWYYVKSNPSMSEMGRRTLGRIVASA